MTDDSDDNLDKIGLHNQVLDFAAIKREFHLPEFVRKLVSDIEKTGAKSVGLWLKGLAHLDFFALQIALESLEGPHSNLPPAEEATHVGSIALIIVELLAVGEGLSVLKDADDRVERVGLLKHFVNIESLKRKGIPMEVFYENMSLDDTFDINGESPIVAKMLNT
jgi:hypothetical protein